MRGEFLLPRLILIAMRPSGDGFGSKLHQWQKTVCREHKVESRVTSDTDLVISHSIVLEHDSIILIEPAPRLLVALVNNIHFVIIGENGDRLLGSTYYYAVFLRREI